MTANDDVDAALVGVVLANTSTIKFDPLRATLAGLLDLAETDIYVIGASSRASNMPIRMSQGKAQSQHFRLGVAVIGTDELALAQQHLVAQVRERYDAAAVVMRSGHQPYELRAFAVREGDPLEVALKNAFPGAQVTVVPAADPNQGHAAEGASGVSAEVAEASFVALPIDTMTLSALRAETVRRDLIFTDHVLISCLAGLRAGKHLLLSGAPGTGKTSLAEAIASVATSSGVAAGQVMTTATSDWTSVDTVGAYRMAKSGELEFRPGLIVDAIAESRWAIIDEFNRADIDKAIGQLFTLLSGAEVVLPHEVEEDGEQRRLALVPEGTVTSGELAVIEVGGSWRLIATMNDTDLDLLYDVSQALKRRFLLVDVPGVSGADLQELLRRNPTGNDDIDSFVSRLAMDVDFRLGAAMWIDLAGYLRERLSIHSEENVPFEPLVAVSEAVSVIFGPQGLTQKSLAKAVRDAHEALAGTADGADPVTPDEETGPGDS